MAAAQNQAADLRVLSLNFDRGSRRALVSATPDEPIDLMPVIVEYTGQNPDALTTSFSKELAAPSPTRSSPSSALLPTTPSPSRPRTADSSASHLTARLAHLSLHDDDGSARAMAVMAYTNPHDSATTSTKTANPVLPQHSGEAGPESAGAVALQKRPSDAAQAQAALLADIASLASQLQSIHTLVFEIQELRHRTSIPVSASAPAHARSHGQDTPAGPVGASESDTVGDPVDATDRSSGTASELSAVDAALMQLDERIDEVSADFATAEKQAQLCFGTPAQSEDSSQMRHLLRRWSDLQADWQTAQNDASMLREELTEDKWLTVFRTVSQQAEDMMSSLDKICSQSNQFVNDINSRYGSMHGPTSSISQQLRDSWTALQKSLSAKTRYYSPACDRVLKILGKGIADRSTKNGEALRTFSELKLRWRSLLDQIAQTQIELDGVGKAFDQSEELSTNRMAPDTTPSRPDRQRVAATKSISTPSRGLPMSQSSPTLSALGRSSSSQGISVAKTPPRPSKSPRRMTSGIPTVTPPRTPSGLSHRRSASNLDASKMQASSLSVSAGPRTSRRAPSPALSASGLEKPRWSISAKRTDDKLSATPSSRPPLSASSSSHRASGRTSAMGVRRPSSRMSIGSAGLSHSYHGERPVSPAFSDASSTIVRDRPSTPSRIPLPASTQRRQSMSAAFSSLHDSQPTSLLQRAMSPTPDFQPHRSLGNPRSNGAASSSRQSLAMPGTLSPPRMLSPTPSSSSSSAAHGRTAHTPEPRVAAQARRLSHVRMPSSSSSSSGARPPPVPRLPSNYRRESIALGTASSNGDSSRRLSVAPSTRRDGSISPAPRFGMDADGTYVPNPIDPLDMAVAHVVNSLPLGLDYSRIDPPLTLSQVSQCEILSARYAFSLSRVAGMNEKAVFCKLVDRLGPRVPKGGKKVLVRVGGGWQELEAFLMSLLASGV